MFRGGRAEREAFVYRVNYSVISAVKMVYCVGLILDLDVFVVKTRDFLSH